MASSFLFPRKHPDHLPRVKKFINFPKFYPLLVQFPLFRDKFLGAILLYLAFRFFLSPGATPDRRKFTELLFVPGRGRSMPDGVDWNATLEKSCSRVSRTLCRTNDRKQRPEKGRFAGKTVCATIFQLSDSCFDISTYTRKKKKGRKISSIPNQKKLIELQSRISSFLPACATQTLILLVNPRGNSLCVIF